MEQSEDGEGIIKEEPQYEIIGKLYKEEQESEELKKAFVSAFKEGKTEEFLKNHNCDASAADVMTFLKGTQDEFTSEDDLAKIAGGACTVNCCHTDAHVWCS